MTITSNPGLIAYKQLYLCRRLQVDPDTNLITSLWRAEQEPETSLMTILGCLRRGDNSIMDPILHTLDIQLTTALTLQDRSKLYITLNNIHTRYLQLSKGPDSDTYSTPPLWFQHIY